MRGLVVIGEAIAERSLAEGVAHGLQRLEDVVGEAPTFAPQGALLSFVLRLTVAPRTVRASHHGPLRADGYDDRAIHDVVQVVCCFSYMNRLADGLGVTAHPEAGGWAERLLGAERVAAHRRWAAGDD